MESMDNRRVVIVTTLKLMAKLIKTIWIVLIAVLENLKTNFEDEELLKLVGLEVDNRTCTKRRQPPRLYGFTEFVVPQFNSREFQGNFRLHPATAKELENLISLHLTRHGKDGRLTVPPRKQMLAVIWLLATPDSYRSINQKFGISKSTLHHCFRRVYQALNKLTPLIISCPSTLEKTHQTKFSRHSRFARRH